MTKLIHLDIAALLILVIILISQFTRRMSKGTTNHFFIALVIMTILSGAADIWAVVLDNAGSLNLGLRTAAHRLWQGGAPGAAASGYPLFLRDWTASRDTADVHRVHALPPDAGRGAKDLYVFAKLPPGHVLL